LAYTVHPYKVAPEKVIPAYEDLRNKMDLVYHKRVPIWSGEWGYPTCIVNDTARNCETGNVWQGINTYKD